MLAKFEAQGIDEPLRLSPYRFVNTVLGWMLDGRPVESTLDKDGKIQVLGQRDLLAMLDGEKPGSALADEVIAEAYSREGADVFTGGPMSPIKIKMLEELRSATTPEQKMAIRIKYADIAASAAAAAADSERASSDG